MEAVSSALPRKRFTVVRGPHVAFPGVRPIWVVWTLVGGLILDYGGGFGLKVGVVGLALLWTVTRYESYSLYSRRWHDFVIAVILPAMIAALHLFAFVRADKNASDLVTYAVRFYNTISAPLLLLLFPLIYFAGAVPTARAVSIALRLVAVVV